jgi:hypothetical protein
MRTTVGRREGLVVDCERYHTSCATWLICGQEKLEYKTIRMAQRSYWRRN